MRLAYEQGLLKGPSLSPYQLWALQYMMSYKRWFIREVQDSALENLLLMFKPDRWKQLFGKELPDLEDPELGEAVPMTESDLLDIDAWLSDPKNQAALNGGAAPVVVQGPEDGWR